MPGGLLHEVLPQRHGLFHGGVELHLADVVGGPKGSGSGGDGQHGAIPAPYHHARIVDTVAPIIDHTKQLQRQPHVVRHIESKVQGSEFRV